MQERHPSSDAEIVNEFAAYYNADELPDVTTDGFAGQLPGRAAESADRLRHIFGDDGARELAGRLRAMAADRGDPLLPSIANATMLDWHTDEPSWGVMHRLLTDIADDLDGGSRS